jgi:HlyD family secretion protein
LIAVVIVLTGVTFFGFSIQQDKLAADRQRINNIGYIEAKEVTVAFKVPGKIEKIMVEEGDCVKAGDVLAVLESKEIAAKVKQAEGALEMAQAKYEQAQIGENLQGEVSESQIEMAKGVLAQAQANLDAMTATWERVQKLYEKGSVSEQKRDEVRAQYEAALGAVAQAQGALASAIAGEKQVQIRESDVRAVVGALRQAEGAYEEAMAYLENCTLKAPCDGTITLRTMDAGEMVNAGTPVFTITDLANTWVQINVPEDKIGRVKLGQEAEVRVDSFPGEVFKGTVTWISDVGEFAVKKAVNEQYEHDIKTFKVKIAIPNQELKLKVGMTAVVNIKEDDRQ